MGHILGLGLPWLIATATHSAAKYTPPDVTVDGERLSFPEGSYPVLAGDLGFSVVLFCCCASVCILTLYLRRFTVGAELGGPEGSRNATSFFFIALWLIYVVASALHVKGHLDNPFKGPCDSAPPTPAPA